MMAGHLALIVAAVFSGAAVYVNLVEQPARFGFDARGLLAEWNPSYKRGTMMQAPLALAGFALGFAAWWQTRDVLSHGRHFDARELAVDDSRDQSSKRSVDGHRVGASWSANESIDCEMGTVARGSNGSRVRSDKRFSMGVRVSLTEIVERSSQHQRILYGFVVIPSPAAGYMEIVKFVESKRGQIRGSHFEECALGLE